MLEKRQTLEVIYFPVVCIANKAMNKKIAKIRSSGYRVVEATLYRDSDYDTLFFAVMGNPDLETWFIYDRDPSLRDLCNRTVTEL